MPATHRTLEKACAKNPTSILFARVADGYLAQGDVSRALEVCQRGLRYRPSYATGHIVMGRCHLATGRLEEAKQEFHKALQLDADNVAALWHIGQIEFEMGCRREALSTFKKALVLDPFGTELAGRVADLEMGLEAAAPEAPPVDMPAAGPLEGEPARAALELPPGLPPADPAPREALPGLIEEICGRPGTLGSDRAAPAGPHREMPVATFTLAELYAEQGLAGEAIAVLRRLTEQCPEDQRVTSRLDELLADEDAKMVDPE